MCRIWYSNIIAICMPFHIFARMLLQNVIYHMGNLLEKWKIGKIEKQLYLCQTSSNHCQIFSHIVKFDFGLGNNFCGTVTSFILLRKFILCFWDKFVEKNGKKVGDFNITFQNESIFLRWQGFFLCFYTPLGL